MGEDRDWGIEIPGKEEAMVAFEIRGLLWVSGVNFNSKTKFSATSLSVSLKLFERTFNHQGILKDIKILLLFSMLILPRLGLEFIQNLALMTFIKLTTPNP